MPDTIVKKEKYTLPICLLLVAVTLILYWPVTRHGFVDFDDQDYITQNPHVTSGLSWSNILWAFKSSHAANWHPVTWISHMLDCRLYGLNPGLHHLTNLIFHIANTLLLFLLLRQMTGSLRRSAFVAALFAWHPLHVESVAWAAERKDVLSAFFWLLTMMAYVRYVKKPGGLIYAGTLCLFALGLMSKAMLVTLPFVLLLVDFWPLRRFGWSRPAAGTNPPVLDAEIPVSSIARILCEKIPFLLLAAGASAITYVIQKNNGVVWTTLTFPMRLANAVMAYTGYISKMFLPVDLAVIYPYHHHWPLWMIAGAVLFLTFCSGLFVLKIRRQPYLAVGWFWFLGVLVPTIGLVQVGAQSMADRYTYIPGIGFFILTVWGAADFAGNSAGKRKFIAVFGVAFLAGCLVCTREQIKVWQNSETLFYHAVKVIPDNYVCYDYLGNALAADGQNAEALIAYAEAARIAPQDEVIQFDYGTALMRAGQLNNAAAYLNAAVKDRPDYEKAQINLGAVLVRQGDWQGASVHFNRAIELKPDDPEAYYSLGTLLLTQSKNEAAGIQFAKALKLKPDYAAAEGNLAIAFAGQGRTNEAFDCFAKAAQLDATNSGAQLNFGLALLDRNKPVEAAGRFSAAMQLDPANPQIRYQLAVALTRQHKIAEAVAGYRQALALNPDFPDALDNLAWILCTDSRPEIRDGEESVRLATKACELTKYEQAEPLLTLAAADAETGHFTEAMTTVQKARALASAAGWTDLAAKADAGLKLYLAGQPCRENF